MDSSLARLSNVSGYRDFYNYLRCKVRMVLLFLLFTVIFAAIILRYFVLMFNTYIIYVSPKIIICGCKWSKG